jgi:hypothetical protein
MRGDAFPPEASPGWKPLKAYTSVAACDWRGAGCCAPPAVLAAESPPPPNQRQRYAKPEQHGPIRTPVRRRNVAVARIRVELRLANAHAALTRVVGSVSAPIITRCAIGLCRVTTRDAIAGADVVGAYVAVVCAGRALGFKRVSWTDGAATRAGFGYVAIARGGAAHHRGWLEAVGRAISAATRAGLGHVAISRGGTAHHAGVTRGVHARRSADRPVAQVGGTHLPVIGAGGARRFNGVGRTRGAGTGTVLGDVALVGRRAAH